MRQQVQWVRVDPSRTEFGVSCDKDGPSIGPIRLLKRTAAGFKPREAGHLEFVLYQALGHPTDISRHERTLGSVAAALDKGDLAYAVLLTQFMRLPSLHDSLSFRRAVEADKLLKAGFNPDQLRGSHGRWATGGEQSSSNSGSAGNDNSAGFQLASAACTNCHAVVPPIPPVWQGPFDDLLFGPQLTRPNSEAEAGFHDALMACHES